MAPRNRKQNQNQAPAPAPRIISAAEYAQGWDSERRVHELNDLSFSLKETVLYVPAKTKADMDKVAGGLCSTVKFRTFPDGRVWVTPCKPNDPDARTLTPTTDTQSAAQLGFAIPLRKLNIKVPPTRQFVFQIERVPVENGGAVYEIDFKDFVNQRRQVDEEALAAIKKAKAEKARLRRAQKRAERIAKANGQSSGGAPGAQA